MHPAPLSAAVARVVRKAGIAGSVLPFLLVLLACTATTATPPPTAVGTSSPTTRATRGTPAGTPPPTSTTTSTTAPPNPAFTPEQQAVADAYRRAHDAFVRSGEGGLPGPELAETMVDPMLRHVRVERANAYGRHEAVRYPTDSKSEEVVRSVAVEGNIATLHSCSIDDAVVFNIDSGAIVNDAVTTSEVKSTLVRAGGTWKLEGREIVSSQPGVVPCD